MPEYTIDTSAHPRLKTFVAGKGLRASGKVDVNLTDREAAGLLRKAEANDFKGAVKAKANKTSAKAKANKTSAKAKAKAAKAEVPKVKAAAKAEA